MSSSCSGNGITSQEQQQQQPRSKRLRERQQAAAEGEETGAAAATVSSQHKRPRAAEHDEPPAPAPTGNGNGARRQRQRPRWKAHQMAEDYVRLAGHMVLHPLTRLGPYGCAGVTGEPAPGGDGSVEDVVEAQQQQHHGGSSPAAAAAGSAAERSKSYPLQHMSALAYLKSAVRRPTVVERWSPYEIALFEAALAEYGKEFYRIAKEIGSKTTQEVIEFYYIWKKTSHYQQWKKEYTPDYLLEHSDDEA